VVVVTRTVTLSPGAISDKPSETQNTQEQFYEAQHATSSLGLQLVSSTLSRAFVSRPALMHTRTAA
jgi:hypothetical protein